MLYLTGESSQGQHRNKMLVESVNS